MKMNNLLLVGLITILFYCSCTNNGSTVTTSATLSEEDSAKIAFYDKYFAGELGIVPNDKNKPIDPKIAQICVDEYLKIKKGDLNDIKQMLKTESVSFELKQLTSWLTDTLKNVPIDTIRMTFGVYESQYIQHTQRPDSLKGKVSLFLWPYYKGKKARKPKSSLGDEEVEPFNFGDLNP